MNTPKISWYAQKGEYGHLITAEISLGSARYREMQIIPCWEHLVDQRIVLACTIERMQKNMDDVLNEIYTKEDLEEAWLK